MSVCAVVEGFLVDWRIIQILRQSFINRSKDVVDNTQRVLRFLVDIEPNVNTLVITCVQHWRGKEPDIKEVYDFFVGFNRDFKVMLAKDVAEIFLNLLCLSGRCLGYTKAVVVVQAQVLATFLLNAVREVGANELTWLCAVKAAHAYIEMRSVDVFLPRGSPVL